jgi:hypothetical protein
MLKTFSGSHPLNVILRTSFCPERKSTILEQKERLPQPDVHVDEVRNV